MKIFYYFDEFDDDGTYSRRDPDPCDSDNREVLLRHFRGPYFFTQFRAKQLRAIRLVRKPIFRDSEVSHGILEGCLKVLDMLILSLLQIV